MRNQSRFFLVLRTIALSLLLVALFAPFSMAQKQVEIEIAGPWDYVPDYDTPGNIIVFAPSNFHAMAVFSGADVYNYLGEPHLQKPGQGIHKLAVPGYDHAQCGNTPPPPLKELYPVSADKPTIEAALGAKGYRYALSLPMPCSYESYLDARAKIDTSQISESTPDKPYVTWMILHYTLPNALSAATLTVTNDTTPNVSTDYSVPFLQSLYLPKAYAISVDMYFATQAVEDYACDKHSAAFFDIALGKKFWNVSNVYRLFPELDHTGHQTNRYNHDPNICPQVSARSSSHSNETIASLVGAIRAKVRMSPTPQDPTDLLTELRKEVDESFEGTARSAAEQDINDASRTIKNVLDRQKPCASAVADQLLSVTLYIYDNKSPGRADCHSMQFNVADAIQ